MAELQRYGNGNICNTFPSLASLTLAEFDCRLFDLQDAWLDLTDDDPINDDPTDDQDLEAGEGVVRPDILYNRQEFIARAKRDPLATQRCCSSQMSSIAASTPTDPHYLPSRLEQRENVLHNIRHLLGEYCKFRKESSEAGL